MIPAQYILCEFTILCSVYTVYSVYYIYCVCYTRRVICHYIVNCACFVQGGGMRRNHKYYTLDAAFYICSRYSDIDQPFHLCSYVCSRYSDIGQPCHIRSYVCSRYSDIDYPFHLRSYVCSRVSDIIVVFKNILMFVRQLMAYIYYLPMCGFICSRVSEFALPLNPVFSLMWYLQRRCRCICSGVSDID